MATKKAKSKIKQLTTAGAALATLPVDDLNFYKSMAQSLLPDENDPWKITEFAVGLQFNAHLMRRNWEALDRLADSGVRRAAVTFTLKVDRRASPPKVSAKLAGVVKRIADSAEMDVPDPTQTELPGFEVPGAEQAANPAQQAA